MKAVIDMKSFSYYNFLLITMALVIMAGSVYGQNRDNLPAEFREYTNPEEIVRFDRTTSFTRAIDVISEFAQQFRGKAIVNQTDTSGEIGISVPPMHWMDALKLILKVNELHLLDKSEFFEIVTKESLEKESGDQQPTQAAGAGGGEQQGPIATTQTQEVRINAIFFEGNRRALQEIGVDWSTISENVPEAVLGGGQGGGQGGQGGGQVPSSEFDGPFVQVNSKGAQNVSQDVFNSLINVGEIGNTGIEVQALFSAFEADNLGEILASPTVKVMDGQEGNIQVGQDFSIKQRDIAGNVLEKFVQVGTILTVTPQVITQRDTTFIHLDIAAERSSAQPDPVSTIINKQEANTQALLLDGEATVIAGLYRTEKAAVRRGVPILKDLPPWFFGLRYLFGYESHDFQMRELVIVLKASLEPTIPDRYDKGDKRSKYDVLQDERTRMHQEVGEADKILDGDTKDLDDFDKAGDESDEKEQKDEVKSELEPDSSATDEEDSDQEENNSEEDKNNDNSGNDKEKPPEDDPKKTIQDPEVETQKVELNLGGDDSETDDSENNGNAGEGTGESTANAENEANQNGANYYIIGGSFQQMENANAFREELQNKGFDSATIKMQGSEINLVAYQGYANLASAEKALADIRQNQNSEAWLYKAQ